MQMLSIITQFSVNFYSSLQLTFIVVYSNSQHLVEVFTVDLYISSQCTAVVYRHIAAVIYSGTVGSLKQFTKVVYFRTVQ